LRAVTCEDLSKRFGDVVGLDRLHLEVEEGIIFGFLGPNGAGKTTTLKLLTGLSRPSGGRARVDGVEVAPGSHELQRRIGYLPEEPAFYGWMTGWEYLVFVGEVFRVPSMEIKKRSGELLELVDLDGAASRRIGGYSRGMRQRLGIAQALMNRPRVLFLDEPSSALDPVGRAEVLETLVRLREESTTVFLSSHILADVERVCDVVGIIDRGRLIVQAGVEELRQRFARPVFELEFEESPSSVVDSLTSIPWVLGVEADQRGGVFRLRVSTLDEAQAKRELPRIAVDSGLTLRHYELAQPSLEDVFIQLLASGGG
jgi:ABC-2 type transport system ATP-binding protein